MIKLICKWLVNTIHQYVNILGTLVNGKADFSTNAIQVKSKTKVDSEKNWAEYAFLICYFIFTFTCVAFVWIRFTLPRAFYACVQRGKVGLKRNPFLSLNLKNISIEKVTTKYEYMYINKDGKKGPFE